jgi:transcriptional regulator of acetoin/glycerol metabolism
VFGHEHYAERLEGLACAGVPLHHPVSGKTVGVLDLTCWRRHADPLLVSLVKSTADQINQALLAGSNGRDVELLREYARACKRTGGIVLALGNDIVMMNDYARQVLDPLDQAALINRAAEILAARRGRAATIDLPTGAVARMHCKLVHDDSPFVDGVVHVKLMEMPRQVQPRAPIGKTAMSLPGLVGSGVLWQRACRDVEAAYDSGEWLALQGEAGVGKLAMARAVHQRRNPAGVFHVLDAAAATSNDWVVRMRRELLEAHGTVVIRHVEALGSRQLYAVSAALQEARAAKRERPLWVVITVTSGRPAADLTTLLRQFPSTVELPPLRHHIEDLAELVSFFLAKLSQHGRLTCSPEAMQLLQRSKWPGNTEQLWQVLRQVIRRRRAGPIQPMDLPPECWTVSRRLLSPLESMERDAIVSALLDHDGNKLQAAESLGMSRATIYRKIREYGIVTPSARQV